MNPLSNVFQRITRAWHELVPPEEATVRHVEWTSPAADEQPGRRRGDRRDADTPTSPSPTAAAPPTGTPQRRHSDRHSWDEARPPVNTSVRSDSITKIR